MPSVTEDNNRGKSFSSFSTLENSTLIKFISSKSFKGYCKNGIECSCSNNNFVNNWLSSHLTPLPFTGGFLDLKIEIWFQTHDSCTSSLGLKIFIMCLVWVFLFKYMSLVHSPFFLCFFENSSLFRPLDHYESFNKICLSPTWHTW